MQEQEINGFVIDSFNQHSLDEKKKQGICPLCSSDRQPKNKKAQCASYDWERGSWYLSTIVIQLFNYILINAKELARKSILDQMNMYISFCKVK